MEMIFASRTTTVALAGLASRLSSETIAAWVYWAIMCPLSTPGSSARGKAAAGDVQESVGARPLMLAGSATAMARKSSTADRGAVEVAV
jgi:hypothetical protein